MEKVVDTYELSDALITEMENAVYDETIDRSENAAHMERFLCQVAKKDMETIELSKKMIIK